MIVEVYTPKKTKTKTKPPKNKSTKEILLEFIQRQEEFNRKQEEFNRKQEEFNKRIVKLNKLKI